MRPLLQHASRSIFANPSFVAPARSSASSFRNFVKSASSTPSVCLQCQLRASVAFPQRSSAQWVSHPSTTIRRRFHPTPNDEKKPRDEKDAPAETKEPPDTNEPILAEPAQTVKKEGVVDNIARVPAKDLPSHKEAQRWDFSKRLTGLMDELLPKLAVVTHKVNTYTGTDYSGIEALRNEIKEQEKLMKARRAAIEEAKHALDSAHSQQASAQKEVVALLERKHSWSATDLERYMSLIRSEHVNDQAVREAKDAVAAAENGLEEARSQLERRERAQYHEEQIWSDTIRRNSTWVTFGLMGFNILLLLTSLILIEPWRRRRIVREIKTALEAQRTAVEPAAPATALQALEAEIEKVIEPIEAVAENAPVMQSPTAAPTTESEVAPPVEVKSVQEAVPETTTSPQVPGAAPLTPEEIMPQEAINIEAEVKADATPTSWRDNVIWVAKDIFSERTISIRRVDYTTAVLQGAAAGAVVCAAIIAMLGPR